LRQRALRRISANANGPGAPRTPKAGPGSTVIPRAQQAALSRLAAAMGIVAIESRPGTLAADVAVVPGPAGTSITVTLGADGTPGSAPLTSPLGQPVTYAAPGAKDLAVTVPTNYKGEAQITVA
jgi:hypothetical protein